MSWRSSLPHDPVPPLLASGHAAVVHWTRDLLGEEVPPALEALWELPVPRRILRHQAPDGSWPYPGRRPRGSTDYNLLETYRQLGFLVEMFGLTREHPAIARAADYVLAHQSTEGDLRGIYGTQPSPNYTAGFVELLVTAGYAEDPRVERAFGWLEECRQDDGGWALPFRTRGRNLDALSEAETIAADTTRPFSHLITGIVLRAFAAHPSRRSSTTAATAARLLAGRLFEADTYPDKGRPADWTEFCYPFWMTDLVSALDAISRVHLPSPLGTLQTAKVNEALGWLAAHQAPDGLFTAHLLRDRFHDLRLWFSLAVCRVFARVAPGQGEGPRLEWSA